MRSFHSAVIAETELSIKCVTSLIWLRTCIPTKRRCDTVAATEIIDKRNAEYIVLISANCMKNMNFFMKSFDKCGE